MLLKKLVQILLITLLTLTLAGCGEPPKTQTNTSQTQTDPSISSSSVSTASVPAPPVNFQMKETVNVNGLQITVNSVRIDGSMDIDTSISFDDPRFSSELSRFLESNIEYILDITIDNITNNAINISSLMQMHIYDGEGYRYDSKIFSLASNRLDGSLGPGRKIRGEVGFELAMATEKLEFSFISSVDGDTVFFDVPNPLDTMAFMLTDITPDLLISIKEAATYANLDIIVILETETSNEDILCITLTEYGPMFWIIQNEQVQAAYQDLNDCYEFFYLTQETYERLIKTHGDAFDKENWILY